jgi:hypothetical protein
VNKVKNTKSKNIHLIQKLKSSKTTEQGKLNFACPKVRNLEYIKRNI